MKGKIALFSNGYNDESLIEALEGVREIADERDVDVFLFVCYSAYNEIPGNHIGELNIYNLPHPEDFDGMIIFTSMLNSYETACELRDKAFDYNVPAVSVGIEIEGLDTIKINNVNGTLDLVNHLISKHNAKDIVFVAGPKENLDSDIRLQTVKKAVTDAGLPFGEENLYYGDWSQNTASVIAMEILKNRSKLPDAIVCANDNTALAICSTLISEGVDVPNRVVVTGFDYSTNGQIFYPSITTVKQDFRKIGKASAEQLFRIIDGDNAEDEIQVPTEFITSESCGCGSSDSSSIRLRFCQKNFFDYISDDRHEWHMDVVADGFFTCPKIEDIFKTAVAIFEHNREYEGENFSILLDKGYINSIKSGGNPTRIDGYSEFMDVLYSVEDGVTYPEQEISNRELVPGYKKIPGESNIYIFLPLHVKEFVYGYMVFKNATQGVKDRSYRTYINRMSQILERLKQNLKLDLANRKLEDLYVKDQLTGLYNRHGFERVGVPYFNQKVFEGRHVIIFFIDVNNMKGINDKYGHVQGDNALKTVGEAIMKVIPADWIPVRFGGDEYIVLGEHNETYDVVNIQKRITGAVETESKRQKLPYRLSVSCGYVVTDPKDHLSLDAYIKQADETMYAIKKELHKRENY